jgi:hypothetical protein
LATGKLITCGLGGMLMWERIHQMSNGQTTSSHIYRTTSIIWMTKFSGTQSLLHQTLHSRD